MTYSTLGVQGHPGSYAHMAAQALSPQAEVAFYRTFEDAIRATEEGNIQGALIPIENSSMGRIADSHALLPATHLQIVAEHYLPVQHGLLALPGTELSQLRTAHSQLPALVQCRSTLRRLGLEEVLAADTALAAKEVAASRDITRAAVASPLAAELYGLEMLKFPLNDHAHNTTRFILLAPLPNNTMPDPLTPCKTSLMFRVPDSAGALYAALGSFAAQGVNLSKLESYLDTHSGTFTMAEFYAEFTGHPAQPKVAAALADLAKSTSWVRLMGVYPSQLANQTAAKGNPN